MRHILFGASTLLALIGFAMVPGLLVLHRFGILAATISVLIGVCLILRFIAKPVWTRQMSLREYIVERMKQAWQIHPLLTALCGLVFVGVGIWVFVELHSDRHPAPEKATMTVTETYWFGVVFLLLGVGVSGMGLSVPRNDSM